MATSNLNLLRNANVMTQMHAVFVITTIIQPANVNGRQTVKVIVLFVKEVVIGQTFVPIRRITQKARAK